MLLHGFELYLKDGNYYVKTKINIVCELLCQMHSELVILVLFSFEHVVTGKCDKNLVLRQLNYLEMFYVAPFNI